MDALIAWFITQGWPGVFIIALSWLYYNERKERMEITRLYMQLQLEIMEILSDAKEQSKES